MSLKAKATQGIVWVAIERFGQQGLQIITFIALARMLTPEDFGLTAMISIFFVVSQSLVDSGMGQALIRETEITNEDRATVFWTNIMISFILYLGLYIAAPYIAIFYNQPKLIILTRFMGLSIVFYGLSIVQRSEMTQQLQFKKQAYAQIPSVLIAGVVSITLAYFNYGVWSLAIQYVLLAAINSILLWIIQPQKILIKWSKSSFNKFFTFGYKLLISGLIATFYNHIYKLIIGKIFSASTLGFFTQARRMQDLVTENLVSIIQKVTYPLLAKSNRKPEILKENYRKIIILSSFIIFPNIIILFLYVHPILEYVFGTQWLPAAKYVQLLNLSGILYHLHAINLNLLMVTGRSDLFLKLEVIKKINITIAIVVGIQFGIQGLLLGMIISSYIALFINTYYTSRFIAYSFIHQMKDVLKVFVLSIPLILLLSGLNLYYPIESIIQLITYITIGYIVYFAGNLFIKSESRQIILSLISSYIPKEVLTKLQL